MSSKLGTLFSVTTFGESHGKGVGAVVDGCPPGLSLSETDIQPQLDRRDLAVFEQEPTLGLNPGRCLRYHLAHAAGVLSGQRGDYRQRPASERNDAFYVGLDAGPAARIVSADGQDQWKRGLVRHTCIVDEYGFRARTARGAIWPTSWQNARLFFGCARPRKMP